MQIYENVKRLCSERKMSIRQLEMKAGIGNGVIGKWRYVMPELRSLQKAADALGVPIITILYGDGKR